jgi:hypothetical protein
MGLLFWFARRMPLGRRHTGTSFSVVGIPTITYPLQPAATRTPAQQDQADKGGKSQSQYSRMQQEPGFKIVEQVQHGITSAQFLPNLIQDGKRIHCSTIDGLVLGACRINRP